MQQFLDKHSRSCWRRPPRYALFLRRATPTRSYFSRADVAFVCAALPAAPYFFVGPRQRGSTFPGRTPPLLASPSPLRLIPPSDHANTTGNFPGGHRLCWRPHPRYALFLHRTTPTRPEISRADVAFVCVPLPATPCFSIGPRQRGPTFPGRMSPLFASPSPLRLVSSSGHANAVPLFPDAAFVCAALPAALYFFVGSRQRGPTFPGQTPPLLASPYPLRLVSPSGYANTTGNFPAGRRLCLLRPPRCALFLRLATPTRSHFSRADAAFIGVPLPAAPYFFVGSRQRDPTFPGRTPPLLAPHSPLRLVSLSGHANAVPLFPGGRRFC